MSRCSSFKGFAVGELGAHMFQVENAASCHTHMGLVPRSGSGISDDITRGMSLLEPCPITSKLNHSKDDLCSETRPWTHPLSGGWV